MVCSICFGSDHNKRTCSFQPKAPIGVDLSIVPHHEATSPVKKSHKTHKCSICFSSDHNKRTCEYWFWTRDTMLIADVDEEEDGHQTTENYGISAPEEEEDGHQTTENYGISAPEEEEEVAITVKKTRKCSLCGRCGHNKTTCGVKESVSCQELALLFDSAFDNYKPVKRKITCSLCSDNGHNSRTCSLKCSPCSDQVTRSYCFANLSATKATSMARILECSSIYDEK
jgi:hypothetical protein